MNLLLTIIFFVFGLVFGSFLNAAVWRLKTGKNIFFGRSACPGCHHKLAARDLFPIFSYLVQRARCRYCAQKISWQYPAVELAAAVLFTSAYWHWGLSGAVATNLFFILVLTFVFIFDLKYYLILDIVTLPAIVLVSVVNILSGRSWSALVISGVIGAAFFGLQFLISRGKWIGGGDVRLGALMGVMLPWPILLVAIFLAYVAGMVISLVLVASKKRGWNSELPLGVFLTFATLVCLFYGQEILGWYLGVIGY